MNKNKNIWGKFLEVTFIIGHILWKGTLRGCTYYWIKTATNRKPTWRFPQSLGWWRHSHHIPNLLCYSIPYHASQWIYECSNKTWITCPNKGNRIYHAPPSWNHNVLKKDFFQNKWKLHQFFFQSGSAEINKTQE